LIKTPFKKLLLAFICVLFFTPNNQAQQHNTLLWRIRSPLHSEPSYLYGTMHVGKKEYLNFYDSVYYAINHTNSFYGELDYSKGLRYDFEGSETYFSKKLVFLDSLVKTSGWVRLVTGINKAHQLNMRSDKLEDFLAYTDKVTKDIYEMETGVDIIDIALFKYAQKLGKSIGGLETFQFQMDMMYKVIEARVSDTTIGFEEDTRLNKNLKRFYNTNQLDSMGVLLEKVNLTYRKILFDNRNITMTDSIIKILNTKTAFVAVGCGHLVGSVGILNLLKQKGYMVTPVMFQHKIPMGSMMFVNEIIEGILKKNDKNDTIEEVAPPSKKQD
jgi:uncharacterized protein